VSFDTPKDNRAFAARYGFPFRLLSDANRVVGAEYETVRAPEEPSSSYAKRRTYLLDPGGRIARAYRVTDIPNHPDEVLNDLRSLQGS